MSLPTPTDRQSKLFKWIIENFSKLKTELYSKIFYCGGYNWRVRAYLEGYGYQNHKVALDVKKLSVALDVLDSAELPYGWSINARFSISLINQIRCADTVSKHTEHMFTATQPRYWCCPSTLPLTELIDPRRGFLVNDTIVLEVSVTVPNSYDSKKETGFEPKQKKRKSETGDKSSGNVEADITGISPPPQSTLPSVLGSRIYGVDASSDATATAGKVKFLSYWVSSEAFLLLEKIHGLHKGTFVKFSMKGQALQTMLLESFASFIMSMSSTKVNDVNEEALRLAAISIEDFEHVGLDLRWLKERLEEAKMVKKHMESVNTTESALEVARAKVRELEEGLAKAKAEVVMSSRELGLNYSILKDIV